MDEAKTGGQTVSIIMGSARGDGITASAVEHLRRLLGAGAQVVDLASLRIDRFDYCRTDDRDDFRSVVSGMLASRHVVFATPVYWYAMSGVMKIFFDRLTDLLLDPESRKIGRALAGRDVWLLATGTDERLPDGFREPFERTAIYFGMNWREAFYARSYKGKPLSARSLEQLSGLAARLSGPTRPQVNEQ